MPLFCVCLEIGPSFRYLSSLNNVYRRHTHRMPLIITTQPTLSSLKPFDRPCNASDTLASRESNGYTMHVQINSQQAYSAEMPRNRRLC
jgi:hypothetical protein